MQCRTVLIILFLKYSQCSKGDDSEINKTDKEEDSVDAPNAPQSDSSGDSCIIPLDDLLILFTLTFFIITFLYFFIRYLLRRRRLHLKQSQSVEKVTRRYRFGRIRKNSKGRPWLYPLDPLPKRPAKEPTLDDHDADNLIQSDISTESALNLHDPFNVSSLTEKKSKNYSWFEMSDLFGVALAAILSLLFIFILSNFEE